MLQHRWKLDKKLTAMMIEDFIHDPILAAKVILRVKLPPHEELRLLWMWSTFYTNDDSGFSTGKSWMFGLVSALRSVLFPSRISGILSKTFSQGKLIFNNYDSWYNSSPIFRSCLRHHKNVPRLVHGTDAWVAYFRGGSQIRVLPPNFLQDAERIRSERWNDAYLDEWTTFGNFSALNKTIIGRVTNVNRYKDCPIRQNHIHLASTPNFRHHPSYKMIEYVDHQTAIGNKDYSRFTCNYRHVPDTPEWDWLVNRRVIFHMQSTLPSGVVVSEIDGVWTTDSGSFYNSLIVEAARFNYPTLLTKRSGDAELFFLGVDVAPGGGDQSGSEADDFALSVFRLRIGESKARHVLTVRKNKISDTAMSGLIHKYHRIFNFTFIVIDPGGGGLFLKEKLRNIVQVIDNVQTQCVPIVTITDTSGTVGYPILITFSRPDYYVSQMWGKMASDSVLVNHLHREFKGALENKLVMLSGPWAGWEGNESSWNITAKRKWLLENINITEDDKLKAEMDLAACQLQQVDVVRTKDGVPILDSYGMYSFKSKAKKDSAYSLIYGYCGILIYNYLLGSGQISSFGNSQMSDGPVVVMEEI